MKKIADSIDRGMSYKMAVQGVLLNDQNQGRSMQFLRYVIVWLLRLISTGHAFPKQEVK